ncbi:MAG: UDP-glucose 4-epimerase GalE [Rhodospirillaceae bacterium]|nr:UDP-glucose 4-epimerase GalE [Rhodospirillaceae bacterium]
MSNVLVTGGAGYVGGHICKALSGAGHTPVVFDNFCRGHREFVRWGPLVEANISDKSALIAAMADHNIEAVIHCAALAYVAESQERPMDYYETNVIGSVNVLEAMRESGVPCLVFSSTCAVYGIPASVPVDEAAEYAPISPYGRTKWIVETMMTECARAYGMKCISLRYFNAAGADPDGEIGEWHDPETHLIPIVLNAAADSTFLLSINGTDYETPDGTAIRDYIHVTDLADAHVRAFEFAKTSSGHNVFNLGTGHGASVRDVIGAVENVTDRKVNFVKAARRECDPDCLVANAQKAEDVLGWKPQYPDIETIVAHAWAYFSRQK